MDCSCGSVMYPLYEVHVINNYDAKHLMEERYAVFICNMCLSGSKVPFKQYSAGRPSGSTCPSFGNRQWGRTLTVCNRCHTVLPRIPLFTYGASYSYGDGESSTWGWELHIGDDTIYHGQFYSPEEFREASAKPLEWLLSLGETPKITTVHNIPAPVRSLGETPKITTVHNIPAPVRSLSETPERITTAIMEGSLTELIGQVRGKEERACLERKSATYRQATDKRKWWQFWRTGKGLG